MASPVVGTQVGHTEGSLGSTVQGWWGLKVSTTDSPDALRGTRASLPHTARSRKAHGTWGWALAASALQGSRSPAPAPACPGRQQALLTLDLLVDHQGEMVHLQDVRELAQWVCQVDLEEKRWSAPTGAV